MPKKNPSRAPDTASSAKRPSTNAKTPSHGPWPAIFVVGGIVAFILAILLSADSTDLKKNPTPQKNSNVKSQNSNSGIAVNTSINLPVNTNTPAKNTNEAPPVISSSRFPIPSIETAVEEGVRPIALLSDNQHLLISMDKEDADPEFIGTPLNYAVNLALVDVETKELQRLPDLQPMDADLPDLVTVFSNKGGFGLVHWDEKVTTVTLDGEVKSHPTPGKYKVSADFSPDGTWIIYSTESGEVIKMNLEDDTRTVLGSKTYPAPTATGPVSMLSYESPSISPNGSWIIFEERLPPGDQTTYQNEVGIALLPSDASSLAPIKTIGKSFYIPTEGFTTWEWTSNNNYVSHLWSGNIFSTLDGKAIHENSYDPDERITTLGFSHRGQRAFQLVSGDIERYYRYLLMPSSAENRIDLKTGGLFPTWNPAGTLLFWIDDTTNPQLLNATDLPSQTTNQLYSSDLKLSSLIRSLDGNSLFIAAQTKGDNDLNRNRIIQIKLQGVTR